MEKRFILFIALSFAILVGWQKWFAPKYAPQPQVVAQQTSVAGGAAPAAANSDALQNGSRIKVTTDMVSAEIDTMGGDLRRLYLLKAGQVDDPKKPFMLLDDGIEHIYVAHTGLIDSNIPNLPTHRTLFTSPQTGEVKLEDGKDSVSVRLEAAPVGGVKVAKIYTFKRGSYLIDVSYEITNDSAAPLTTSAYFSLYRDGKPPAGSTSRFSGSSFTGPAVYTSESHFRKVQFKDLDKADESKVDYAKTGHDGWVAMLQHYFVSAWLLSPNQGSSVCAKAECQFQVKATGTGYYNAGAVVPLAPIAAGQTGKITVPLFAGPSENDHLKQAAEGLILVRDYGTYLHVLAEPLFWVLNYVHTLVHNWGWAIVVATILIKVALFPLASSSFKSMAKMKKLAPRMQRLKEQYGEDRMKFQQATMELYKAEKVNPLGGCLPLLLQIPVFFAFYAALGNTAELRQAEWMFWIHDLSRPDPYYVLPILMAGSMFANTFMNPSTGDPMQDRMQKIMPLAFSFFFFALPSGLVLYQVTNSILSMAQQWYITRVVAKETPAQV